MHTEIVHSYSIITILLAWSAVFRGRKCPEMLWIDVLGLHTCKWGLILLMKQGIAQNAMYILHRDLCRSLCLFICLIVSLGAGMNNAMIRELEHCYAFLVGFYLLLSNTYRKPSVIPGFTCFCIFVCVSTNMNGSVCVVIEVSEAIGCSVVSLPLN